MYGKCNNLFHQVKCIHNDAGKVSGTVMCDVHTSTKPDEETANSILSKVRESWQNKLAKITECTEDFTETSVKLLNGVPCMVRYIYRVNQAA